MKTEYDVSRHAKNLKGGSYFETFIDGDSLAAGVLLLRPGQEDTQEPHDADEVYYVVSGDGFLRLKGRDYKVAPDRMYFVPAGAEHRFYGNKKNLKVIYFFGGA